jgi:hypothetical protein
VALIACAALLGAGCATRWQHKDKLASYQPPQKRIALYVVTSEQVNQQDTYGVVLTLVETVERELREEGIETEVVAANGDPPPVPRIELRALESDAGSVAARAIIGYGAGAAEIVVECLVFPDHSGKPSFTGRVKALMGGDGFTTGDPRKAAKHAGEAIADELVSTD